MLFKSATLSSIILLIILLAGCVSVLPSKESSTQSAPVYPVENTRLGRIFLGNPPNDDSLSGNIILRDGQDALRERLHIIDLADHSIDTQYFLWNNDESGRILLKKIIDAANRGVQVRILIDGFSIADHIGMFVLADQHKNISVSIYNPFIARTGFGRVLDLIFDFDRLNQRMHNKTLTVDNVVTVTGGRNIGNAYFSIDKEVEFRDADVLSIGAVVPQVIQSFNDYWNESSAIPIRKLSLARTYLKENDTTIEQLLTDDDTNLLNKPLLNDYRNIYQHLIKVNHSLVWSPTTFVADRPGKRRNQDIDTPKEVALKLATLVNQTEQEVMIESAYFVLNDLALKIFKQTQNRGVRIQVLTNSMASNNLLPNHASYARVRKEIIANNIELYELKPSANDCTNFVRNKGRCTKNNNVVLHAKTAVFDDSTIYIGSMNFNLRSAFLNTESAIFIDSPELNQQLRRQIKKNMNLFSSWKPTILGDDLLWVTFDNGKIKQTRIEPSTTAMERIEVDLLTIFPETAYF